MNVGEYLKELKEGTDCTFIIAKAVKDGETPFYHDEFSTTPIRSAWEWLEYSEFCEKYILIKKDQAPVDISGLWDHKYKKGYLKCCIITTEDDLRRKYSEKQSNDMIKWYSQLMSH